MINLCEKINCKYFSDGRKHHTTGSLGGFGCTKYLTAFQCPVAFIKGTSADQYRVSVELGCAPMVEYCAIKVCPGVSE